jgi:hypothetical protein
VSSLRRRTQPCRIRRSLRYVCDDWTHPTPNDPGRRRAEIPEDDDNHALGARRYLIAKLDARKLGRKPKPPQHPAAAGKHREAEGE